MEETTITSYKKEQIILTNKKLVYYTPVTPIMADFDEELDLVIKDKKLTLNHKNSDKELFSVSIESSTPVKVLKLTTEEYKAIIYCVEKGKKSLITTTKPAKLLLRVNEFRANIMDLTELSAEKRDFSQAQLSFGFEIEFNCVDNDVDEVVDGLNEEFGTSEDVNSQKTVKLGSNTITMKTNAYDERKNVVKVYHDGSVDGELVTRPLYLNEMKGVLDKIYTKLDNYELDYECEGKAGGHITIMEGQHMEIPMPWEVVSNFIQLTRTFYPQIIALSNKGDYYRGLYYYALNHYGTSRNYNENSKYHCVNKRMVNDKIVGLELRCFHSPENTSEAINNAKISLMLYRVAEKITHIGHLSIEQERMDIVKAINSAHNDSEHSYSISGLLKKETLITKIFYDLVKGEAKKLKILPLVRKRLRLGVDLSVKNDEIIKDYFVKRLSGKSVKEAIKLISQRNKLTMKKVEEMTAFLE